MSRMCVQKKKMFNIHKRDKTIKFRDKNNFIEFFFTIYIQLIDTACNMENIQIYYI
jgi:hypothetical protein